jgi:ABC-type bacteriocin/lantibiotic exporter with double-glycine peptidase domain
MIKIGKEMVVQKSVNDCGIACLLYVLKYFGKNVTYKKLEEKIIKEKDGISAYEIIKVSKEFGISSCGYKNLKVNKNLTFPLIAHTINNNVQHFVVVLKVSNNNVYIMDPSYGLITKQKDEFNKSYTGVAILFKNHNPYLLNNVINRKSILLITILILLFTLLSLFYSYLLSYLVESISTKNNLIILFLSFILLGIIKEIFSYVKDLSLLRYQLKTDETLTLPFLKKLFNLPYLFYHDKPVGELISKVNDLSYVKEALLSIVEVLFVNVVIILISFIFLLFLNVHIFYFNFILSLILLLYNMRFWKNNSYKNYDLQMKNEYLNARISKTIENIYDIKNLRKESYVSNKITNLYNDLLACYKDIKSKCVKKDFINKLLILIGISISLLISILEKLDVKDTLFITYVLSFIYDSNQNICTLFFLHSNYKASSVRISELYKIKEIGFGHKIMVNDVEFNNFYYKYNDKIILNDIHFRLSMGDFVLIKGPTGSGKTTLFKALTKKIRFDEMTILINGKNISKYNFDTLRRSIIYVEQDIKLFDDTILENITLGCKLNLRRNFKMVLEEEFKKKGIDYNILVDSANSNLSGGEIALIKIAQVLNNDFDMVIFDETTSSLDTRLEKMVLNAIKKDYKDKIVVFISHRNYNTYLFNKIIKIKDKKGRIIYDKTKTKRIKKIKGRRFKWLGNRWYYSRRNFCRRNI